MSAITGYLKQAPMFSDLKESDLEELAAMTVARKIRKGETLFDEGDEAKGRGGNKRCVNARLLASGYVGVQVLTPGSGAVVSQVKTGTGWRFIEEVSLSNWTDLGSILSVVKRQKPCHPYADVIFPDQVCIG